MKLTKKQRQEIINKLLNNEVLILPTDTIYGLSVLVENNEPNKLNALKHAPFDKPLIVLVDRFKTIQDQIKVDKVGKKLLKSSLPTTVIFRMKKNQQTIAVRLCRRRDVRAILKKTGPIYSTSVNLNTQPPLTTLSELQQFLKNKDNIYWVGSLTNHPSRIYNSITKEWTR